MHEIFDNLKGSEIFEIPAVKEPFCVRTLVPPHMFLFCNPEVLANVMFLRVLVLAVLISKCVCVFFLLVAPLMLSLGGMLTKEDF